MDEDMLKVLRRLKPGCFLAFILLFVLFVVAIIY